MSGFFDKMIEGINTGANNLTEGSKNMVEKAKIKTAIHHAEEEKKKTAELLGVQAYNLYLSGVAIPEVLQNFCVKMEEMDEEIKLQKRNLAVMDAKNTSMPSATIPGGRVCMCGYTNKPNSEFCSKCGNKLGEVK